MSTAGFSIASSSLGVVARGRDRRILAGLGFAQADMDRDIGQFLRW